MSSAWGDSWGAAGGATPPPPAPALAAADAADGSHATATVSGSAPGSGNVVSVLRDGETAWAVAGARFGDGTLSLTLAKGYYWAKCDSSLGGQAAASNVARLAVTDADDSVHARASRAIEAAIRTLSLGGAETRVYRQTLPDENAAAFPAVVVWFNDAEQILGGTNARDDIGYPVHVGVCDRKLTALAVPPDVYLSMRQRIMRRVRNQRLVGVPEVYTVNVLPLPVIDEKLPAFDYLVSAMTFVCVSREVRG